MNAASPSMSPEPQPTRIHHLMVGTAGHVDHGKTSLVRHLTGTDTDRLPEEKRRGMSIDMGVAPCHLDDGSLVGIVDVPGHQDYVRNMVAGISSVQILLLVVAADDSVMPQTVEHLRIAKLLGLRELHVVLTKTDLVSETECAVVEAEVRELAMAHGYTTERIVRVSNSTGEGIAELRTLLTSRCSIYSDTHDVGARHRLAFRMPVRDVFSVKGYGTVVTGVPICGGALVGQTVELIPSGTTVDIRGIQSYHESLTESVEGISTALNLRGCSVEMVRRGDWVSQAGGYTATEGAVAIFLNDSTAHVVKKRSEVKVHTGTGSFTTAIRLLTASELPPGTDALVELRFGARTPLALGDRFVVRRLSPAETLGGGIILSTIPAGPGKVGPTLRNQHELALGAIRLGDQAAARLCLFPSPLITSSALTSLLMDIAPDGQPSLSSLVERKVLHPLNGEQYLIEARLSDITGALRRTLERYHRDHPRSYGPTVEDMERDCALAAGTIDELWPRLEKDGVFARRHGRIAVASHLPKASARELQLRDRVADRVRIAALQAVARGSLQEELSLTERELRGTLDLLLEEDEVVLLGNYVLSKRYHDQARDVLLSLLGTESPVSLARFREATGTSRNVATEILDAFDAAGITKRVEAGRILNTPSRRH